MRVSRRKQIKNKVSVKEPKRYTLIPEGYEKQYERWLLRKQYEEILGSDELLKEPPEISLEELKPDNRRSTFIESLKVDSSGNTTLYKRQSSEERDIFSITMKFLQEKNLNLNDGVKVRIEGRGSVVIKYRNKDGNIITEKVSILDLENEQQERD